ncbi:methylated-DNA--[protein]-cysteine S-methyltransferase [Oceanisphaera pacifica]|uniref:Methylated-DNA--protein-cysteine methyltransferase n=1 Tax=Oceanisphaera pacifica TaxID=2818389 RepID=A0ABS3NIK5_9GAMM|nr:methylated-DNA--[protein]-cysteine S-methyltransferase [Oceanisphaera pacifica]MBO1520416.1 methylated-DNA--[protein]-cysteine S-methyltransferase [Oceanisphaera pacifica]
MSTFCTHPCPLGWLTLATSIDANQQEVITALNFSDDIEQPCAPSTPLQQEACRQLDQYFSGARQHFSLPLAPQGTDFQQGVWQALLKIPFGEHCSYKTIAEQINNPKAVRAVGLANSRNPIALIIPCHRVIGASGKLVGYAGGVERKAWLLKHEARVVA